MGKIQVVQHEAQFARLIDGRGFVIRLGYQAEGSGEFAAAEIGLVDALALPGPAFEHFVVLGGIGLGIARSEKLQIGVYPVGHVAEEQAGALLAIFLDVETKIALARFHCRLDVTGGYHAGYLVAPQVDPADGIQDFDLAHMPADRRFPENRLEAGARGGWRHHVVAHPLDLHLRAGKAGIGAGKLQAVSFHLCSTFKTSPQTNDKSEKK